MVLLRTIKIVDYMVCLQYNFSLLQIESAFSTECRNLAGVSRVSKMDYSGTDIISLDISSYFPHVHLLSLRK